MIAYLKGKILATYDKYVILDVNGVGYRVTLSDKMINSIPGIGSDCKFYIHTDFNMHEGRFELYGFYTQDELSFFELLLSVSGIGPKNAQAIISSGEIDKIKTAIAQNNEKYLCQFGGIGPKTAKRMVLELKDKIEKTLTRTQKGTDLSSEMDAVEALISLGYSRNEAQQALKDIGIKTRTLEEKVKEALKSLGKK
ncbi:MAG: Holliday junction branch migration protein RuvA [Parcubacteria group bacterium]|nr:Holliday junction branch migration protein RuvA [Parcubacteria group bacterium]